MLSVFELVVEREFFYEIIINNIIKNSYNMLTEDRINSIQKQDSKFKGIYAIDAEIYLLSEKTIKDFNDFMRINFIETRININGHIDYLENLLVEQQNKPSHKLYYKKLFFEPYEDFVKAYHMLHNKDPDIDSYKKALSKTNIPEIFELFNHRVKLHVEVEPLTRITLEVLERINNDSRIQ